MNRHSARDLPGGTPRYPSAADRPKFARFSIARKSSLIPNLLQSRTHARIALRKSTKAFTSGFRDKARPGAVQDAKKIV
jgi:hypothetical protein